MKKAAQNLENILGQGQSMQWEHASKHLKGQSVPS